MSTYAEIIMDVASDCVAPVWASKAGNEPAHEVDHNGTITFIDTGSRRIAVTALHVVQRYREMLNAIPTAALAVNLAPGVTPGFINLEIIDESPELDLASLNLPDIRTISGNAKRYFPIAGWPVPLPQKGDPITVVGFPGADRKTISSVGTFTRAGIGMVVSNHPERNVVLADESGTMRTTRDGITKRGGLTPGGISGAAGFFLKNERFHIAGFVYEGNEHILFLTPGARLQSNGTFSV